MLLTIMGHRGLATRGRGPNNWTLAWTIDVTTWGCYNVLEFIQTVWLVVSTFQPWKTVTGWWYTYPSEKYEFVSWDDDIRNIWKFIKFMFQTTNQVKVLDHQLLTLQCSSEKSPIWLYLKADPGRFEPKSQVGASNSYITPIDFGSLRWQLIYHNSCCQNVGSSLMFHNTIGVRKKRTFPFGFEFAGPVSMVSLKIGAETQGCPIVWTLPPPPMAWQYPIDLFRVRYRKMKKSADCWVLKNWGEAKVNSFHFLLKNDFKGFFFVYQHIPILAVLRVPKAALFLAQSCQLLGLPDFGSSGCSSKRTGWRERLRWERLIHWENMRTWFQWHCPTWYMNVYRKLAAMVIQSLLGLLNIGHDDSLWILLWPSPNMGASHCLSGS